MAGKNLFELLFGFQVDNAGLKAQLSTARDDVKGFKNRIKDDTSIELSLNVANIKLQIEQVKQELKKATKSGDVQTQLQLTANIETLKQQLTQAGRELRNYARTGSADISVLGKNFESINQNIERQGGLLRNYARTGSADISVLGKNFESINQNIERQGGLLRNSLSSIGNFGGQLLVGLGVAVGIQQVGQYLSEATTQARNFQQGMSLINTVIQTNSNELGKLGKDITTLSNTYGIATDEIQKLVFEIASAGYELKNLPQLAELSLRGSIATGESAQDIFKGVNSVIKAYGLSVSEATAIADKFFKANVIGQFTVGELSREIQGVVASARTLGVSVDELIAGFTLFTGVVGNTSEVGTGLQRLMDSLSSPSKQALDTLEQYGISYQKLQDIIKKPVDEGGGFLNATKMITNALEGNNLALGKVFDNVNAYKLASYLATLSTEDFTKAVDTLANSQGAMSEALKQVTDDEDFQLNVAQKQWDNFKTGVGNVILKTIGYIITFGKYVGILAQTLVPALGFIVGLFTLGAEAIIRAFIGLGKGLANIFKTLAENGRIAGKNLSLAIQKGMAGLGRGVLSFFDEIITGIEGLVNKGVDGINQLAKLANKIPGVNIGTIGTVSLGRVSGFASAGPGGDYEQFKSFSGVIEDIGSAFDGIAKGPGMKLVNAGIKDVKSGLDSLKDVNSDEVKQVFGDIEDEQKKVIDGLNNQNKAQQDTNEKGKKGSKEKTAQQKEEEKQQKAITQATEEAKNTVIQAYNKIDGSIKQSEDKLKAYQKEVDNVGKKFEDLKKTATDSLREIQKSVTELDVKKGADLGARFVEVEKRIAELNAQSDKTTKDYDELNKLTTERNLILQNTTEEQRRQAQINASMSETQKILNEYTSQRNALLEKQTFLQNLQKSTLSEDGRRIQSGVTEFKILEDGTAQYVDQLGTLQKITDEKTIQYAQDILGKQNNLQADLDAIIQKEQEEERSLINLNTIKKTLEDEFNQVFQQNIASQKGAVKDLFNTWASGANSAKVSVQQLVDSMRQASILQQQMASSQGTGFANGGHTGIGGKYDVAGVVHKGERVMPQRMVRQYSGLVGKLEQVRMRGFAEGGHTSTTNKSINVGNINVRDGFDFNGALESMKRKL